MTVVVISGMVASVAARYSGRASKGEQAGEVARALMNAVL
jgi:hypothetical protein